MKLTVSFPSGKPMPQLSAPGLEPRFAAGEDFWRIHLDTDEIRELTVFSTRDLVFSCSDAETTYTYPKLKAENGETYDITYRLSIREENGQLNFRSAVENRCSVRVNEIQAPFLAFDRLNSAPEDEVLYIPNSLGERIENPRKWVRDTCHTESWLLITGTSGIQLCILPPWLWPGWVSRVVRNFSVCHEKMKSSASAPSASAILRGILPPNWC